jgi:hypothetical protein
MSTLSAGTKQRIDADGFAVIAGVFGYREMDTLKGDMDKTPLHRSRAGARHMLGHRHSPECTNQASVGQM